MGKDEIAFMLVGQGILGLGWAKMVGLTDQRMKGPVVAIWLMRC